MKGRRKEVESEREKEERERDRRGRRVNMSTVVKGVVHCITETVIRNFVKEKFSYIKKNL